MSDWFPVTRRAVPRARGRDTARNVTAGDTEAVRERLRAPVVVPAPVFDGVREVLVPEEAVSGILGLYEEMLVENRR